MKTVKDIHLQVMWNRLLSVVEEQAQTLVRTAFGASTREAGDLSAGVFLPDGRMMAQAVTGTPGHVNSMADSVRHFLAEFPLEAMHPGDVFATNDPWKGTGHLNDFTFVTPVFRRGRAIALFASTLHVVDIGGLGSGPDATEIFHEGLYVPIVRFAARGVVDATLMRLIRANVREPIQVEGDLHALMVCNDIGARRLAAMMDEYRLEDLEALGEHIIGRSRAAMLEAVRRWPRGTWRHTMRVDGYDHPIDLAAALTISDDGVELDFAGTSAAVARGINVPKNYTDAYSSFGVRCIIGADIPNNAGSLGVVRIAAPVNCILNAHAPYAVQSRAIVGTMLPDVVFGCLRQVRPDEVPAEGASNLWNIRLAGGQPIAGADPAEFVRSERFTIVSFTSGGTGARPGKDGLSATSFPSGVKNTAVEIIETMAPLVFWRKEFTCDSGGAGRLRGGLGQTVEVAHAHGAPMVIGATFDRIVHPARGAAGGAAGGAGSAHLASGAVLRGKGRQLVPAGDRVVLRTPGGGGIGDAAARDRAAVAEDLRNGLISERAAREDYRLQPDKPS
ncbi:MAG TPA: hydantoinase B/oxoprolinase family protein [Ramlibacter sp.]|uniref:hydantoinase B/oxoprolinase family protein n=1 Tax=Ramlibacter sp. TaxID=1917967 RepID=UPI002C2F775E|nr:hydantoinase B/oxoprolinase family protein [Ramlibacter sp.]HVZ43577.1 hydantoinase B/oxoprolinase family protein [Ramlibacter sp.]